MMEKGFFVVSGVPRSGTSLAMNIQRAAHGDDRILGEQFPRDARKALKAQEREQQEEESDSLYQVRMYFEKKLDRAQAGKLDPDRERWLDMNPDGFWEMAFTCRGIRYSRVVRKMLLDVKEDWKVIKVVSGGLLESNPDYISKVLYMLRHPRAVAKSQERLFRAVEVIDEKGEIRNLFDDILVHSPEMFIESTVQAALFFLQNPEIAVKVMHFEDLIVDPEVCLKEMQDFVGEGDYSKAADLVKPGLNRSRHEDIGNALWDDAEFIHEQLAAYGIDGDDEHLEKIIERVKDPKSATRRQTKTWRCFRARAVVNADICHECRRSPKVWANMLDTCLRTKDPLAKKWEDEPCVFECGFDVDRETFMTIEESIQNNFWKMR